MNPAPLRWILLSLVLVPVPAVADDWPMMGGRPDRNSVSSETGFPVSWPKGDTSVIKWKADLGDATYGNPVVAGGRVFIGSRGEKKKMPDLPVQGKLAGLLLCFAEKDGALLWRAAHEKLEEKHDDLSIGVCSTPCVDGNRLYYISNRAELVFADVEGFHDGENDGPVTGEALSGKQDVDIVWTIDFHKDHGVMPNQASASSPLVVGDLVYVHTGNGVEGETGKVLNPGAPSFVAVDKKTGKIVWKDASPGAHILTGQWSSPAYAVVDGLPQVCFPGGDGWIYAFDALKGTPLWKVNGKAHEKPKADGKPGTPLQVVAAPVYAGHRLIIGIGEEDSQGNHPGALRCIDARKRGDLTADGVIWAVLGEDFGGTISAVTVHDGLVYAVDMAGLLSCLELDTGKRIWKYDLLSAVWGTPTVVEGRIYLRNGDGEVVVFAAGREFKALGKGTFPDLSHGSVIPANGRLYIAGQTKLYAVGK